MRNGFYIYFASSTIKTLKPSDNLQLKKRLGDVCITLRAFHNIPRHKHRKTARCETYLLLPGLFTSPLSRRVIEVVL